MSSPSNLSKRDEATSFADLRKRTKTFRQGQCSHCGSAPSAGRVSITLQERKEHPDRTPKDANRVTYPAIDSMSRTYCEPCAIRIYRAALVALEGTDA